MKPRRRPPVPDPVIALLTELANRPAMNGGFAKLANQQDKQSERLEAVEEWTAKWDRRWIRMVGVVGAVALSTTGRLIYDGICKLWAVLH